MRTYKRSWPYDPDRLGPNPTEAEIQAVIDDNDIYHLRMDRNIKLQETDWMAIGDRPQTDKEKEYRQALRDITETYSSLEDVVWPNKP